MASPLNQYAGVVAMLVVALLCVAVAYLAHRVTSVEATPVESTPFLSGHAPEQHALSRFHVRWYAVTLVFLAFDVEMLFMYPWAVVVAASGTSAVMEMFAFLGVLMVAVVWVWREGALRWV